MRLHDINPPKTYVAVYWTGGNGRRIGAANDGYHLVPIERSAPPPLPENMRTWETGRTYWVPWTLDRATVPQEALCGGPRTRAHWPRINEPWNPTEHRICRPCLTRAGQWTTIRELNAVDPWIQIPWADRRGAIDPVTGL